MGDGLIIGMWTFGVGAHLTGLSLMVRSVWNISDRVRVLEQESKR